MRRGRCPFVHYVKCVALRYTAERTGCKLKKIAAVICNYNKKEYVAECIQSVTESSFTDMDIVVVDNASTDGSAEHIKNRFGNRVKLLVNEENLGKRRI